MGKSGKSIKLLLTAAGIVILASGVTVGILKSNGVADGAGASQSPPTVVNPAAKGGAQAAITFAESFEQGQFLAAQSYGYWSWCAHFTANVFGAAQSGYLTAKLMYQALNVSSSGGPNAAPIGSLQFFAITSDDHVGITVSQGEIISANEPKEPASGPQIDPIYETSDASMTGYLGWAWPPAQWGPLAVQDAKENGATPTTSNPAPLSVGSQVSGGTVTVGPSQNNSTLNGGSSSGSTSSVGQAGSSTGNIAQNAGSGSALNIPIGDGGGGNSTPSSTTTTTTTTPPPPPATLTLTADGVPAFGNCPSNPPPSNQAWCGGNVSSCTTDAFWSGGPDGGGTNYCKNTVDQGVQMIATCWTNTGQVIKNNYSAVAPGANPTQTSTTWYQTNVSSSAPWVNSLWVDGGTQWTSQLPQCS